MAEMTDRRGLGLAQPVQQGGVDRRGQIVQHEHGSVSGQGRRD